MVDIQEIPLDIEENEGNSTDTEIIIEDNPEIIEDAPAPKRKGRPVVHSTNHLTYLCNTAYFQ